MAIPGEFYPTPDWATVPLVREVRRFMPDNRTTRIFDPGCGNGDLGRAARTVIPDSTLAGYELDEQRARNASAAGYSLVVNGDFLAAYHPLAIGDVLYTPDLVLCNPPFSLWTEFVDRIFGEWHAHHTVVAVLGRLSIMGSNGRYEWWEHKYGQGLKLRALSRRPKFSTNKHGKLASDNSEYAWFVWGLPERSPAVRWYKGREDAFGCPI